MSNINDREKAFETKYALDQEVMFRIEARAAKLFGLWLAEQAGMSSEDASKYAAGVVSANLDEPGFEDVKRAVRPLIAEKSLPVTEHMMDTQIDHFMEIARVQITEEKK
ncbi:MAG: DUF1476 domain-containing protein [Micavibrio aeruginosavorus]|uniref:DUF1476 domain-containing protein n=1 Tax=Micavibrio aeruginosavorus TaxID=349221 RepID=A0A2W5N5J0_9BACT|nr:MAG: DUF1476 domain-containing protein [Micavibrio aeruginosavorus]